MRALVNGCFDGLHDGHRWFLRFALGNCDCLWILLNSDSSVRDLKGNDRPINLFEERARALRDFVTPFSLPVTINVANGEKDIEHLHRMIMPDAVFKSEEYRPHYTGQEYAKRTIWVPRVGDYSTTLAAKGNMRPSQRIPGGFDE